MADTSSNQVTRSTIGVEAPALPAKAEEQKYILPPWEDDSDPSAPIVDTEDNHDTSIDSSVRGLSLTSTTTPLRSSIYDRIEEYGRTYHRFRQGKYLLPIDLEEQERLDIQHALFSVSLGKLHQAPIGPNPINVLDIGTGTGIWAIEFAEQYPSAQVLGTDLSTIQLSQIPPNCRFEVDDAEDDWPFTEPFDYIHGRMLLSCFKDPRSVFQKAYNALTPGGYLEMQDLAFPPRFLGEQRTETSLYKWGKVLSEASVKIGRPWTNVQKYKEWMEEIGFVDVVEKKYYWPLSRWAKGDYYKLVSVYAQASLLNGLDGMSLKLMGLMGWSAEEVKAFLVGVREDVKNTSIHAYAPMRVIYGRKPGLKP
ncbi:S-adenosyl-L-methionine-dependent methyltransferase [Stipitochalara longipes BDJ]|nr:S-adenosyl-L-methionine-dependent methyltransferase [Stipitochalara longipes BDJ]